MKQKKTQKVLRAQLLILPLEKSPLVTTTSQAARNSKLVNEFRGIKIKLRDFSLATRIIFSAILLVVASGSLWIVNQNKLYREANLQEKIATADLALNIQSAELRSTITSLRQDVLFLAKVPPISGIIRATENNDFDTRDKSDYSTWEARLQEIFIAFLEAHPEYSHARLIGVADEGKVLVKALRNEGRIEVTPHQMLRAKGNASYFKAGLTLHNGQVYLSEIDLEKDGNKVEVPHRSTLRAVTPVFDASGHLFGMVVLNLDVQPLLMASKVAIPNGFQGYIANQHGYYLSHPDAKREYEFEFGSKANISDDFFILKSMIGAEALSSIRLQATGGAVSGYVAAKRVFLDVNDHAKSLLLAFHAPKQQVESKLRSISLPNMFQVILVAAFVATLFLLILRSTFSPLKRITAAAREVTAGNRSIRLTETGGDEIGQLSTALNNMLDKLTDHELIKKENVFRRSIVETAHDGFWLVNMQGYLLEVNQAYADMSGYAVDDLVGMHISQLDVKEVSVDEVNAHLKKIIEQGSDLFETQHQHKDGRLIDVEISTSFIPTSEQIVVFSRDISARKHAELLIINKEQQLNFVLESSDLGFWDWDIPSGKVHRNHIWAEMLGYTYDEIKFTTSQWADFVHPDDINNAWKSINDALEGRTSMHELVYRMRTKSGEYKWILDRAKVVQRDAEGKAVRMTGSHADYTERKRLELELTRQAHLDYLTGLSNRRHFMLQGEVELSRAIRYGTPLSVLMLDIDFFKKVNDSYGHQVGDAVLQALSKVCQDTLRQVDVAGRIGGEEFAVILPETEAEEALEVAERLREAVAKAEVTMSVGLPIHFTVSIGVTTLHDQNVNIDMLLNQADKALYEAKETGRNKVCVG